MSSSSQLLAVTLTLLAFVAAASSLSLHLFSPLDVAEYGAICLDGSGAGYYHESGFGGGKNKWVIYLEGGGYCNNLTSCFERTRTNLGSSKYWKSSVHAPDLLSVDPLVNPDFFEFNKVMIPYCGGDLHSGTRRNVSAETFGFYFAGHLTIQGVIGHLIRKEGLGDAEEVLISGSSAGGIGTILNSNYIASKLPNAAVRSAPSCGWFIGVSSNTYVPPFKKDWPSINSEAAKAYSLWASYVPEGCAAEWPEEPYRCFSGNFSFPYFQVPFFVAENLMDSNQIFLQDGCSTNASDPNVIAYIEEFSATMRASLTDFVLHSHPYANSTIRPGLFAPACVDHGVEWTSVHVNGVNQRTALSNWYFGKSGQPTQVIDACTTVACNKDCPLKESMKRTHQRVLRKSPALK